MKFRFVPAAMTPLRHADLLHSKLNSENGVEKFNAMMRAYLTVNNSYTFTSFMRSIFACLAYLKKNDDRSEIILPRFSCPTFAHAIIAAGLKIKYCDINPITLSIDIESLSKLDFNNVLAILCVNHFGFSNPMDALLEIRSRKNIYLIEDIGYSLGTEYKKKKLGSFGDFGILNFKEGKAIPIGGGMIVSNDSNMMPNLGNKPKAKGNFLRMMIYPLVAAPCGYWLFKKTMDIAGINARRSLSMEDTLKKASSEYDYIFNPTEQLYSISDFQGALGTKVLSTIDSDIEARNRNASILRNSLSSLANISTIQPEPGVNKIHYIRYPILVGKNDREKILTQLLKNGIEARNIYSELEIDGNKYPGAKRVSEEILTLPCHPYVKEKDLNITIDLLKKSG